MPFAAQGRTSLQVILKNPEPNTKRKRQITSQGLASPTEKTAERLSRHPMVDRVIVVHTSEVVTGIWRNGRVER